MTLTSPTHSAPHTSVLPAVPFWFIRHGQTDWNVAKRIQGHTDVPLNATGLAQAEQAARLITQLPLGFIVSSPLQRAALTAAVLHAHTRLPIMHDERLRERGYGSFEGKLRTEILASVNRPDDADYHDILPTDSEPLEALHSRILGVLTEHLEQARQREQTPLFVGHGAFMAKLCGLLGLAESVRFANAHPVYFCPTESGWRMEPIDLPEQLG